MKHNNIVSELVHALQRIPRLEAILLVGQKRIPVAKGIDLLAVYRNGGVRRYAGAIMSALQDLWPSGILSVCDDSVRFSVPRGAGGVAIRSCESLAKQIQDWRNGANLEGQRRPWVIGYWLPEALCGDIATATILYDAKGFANEIRDLVSPYPVVLSEAIVRYCADEIRQKTGIAEKFSDKILSIERSLCLNDISASMIRLAFARSHVYLRGFRHLEEQSKSLRLSDHAVYEFAIKLLRRKHVRALTSEINRFL